MTLKRPPHQPRDATRAVTIRDVARDAGVSVATVSRALNDRGHVAEAVRLRVREVADALRYAPHPGARNLSSRSTHTLGVVLPVLHGEFYSSLMRGIDQVARSHGLHLLVSSHHGRRDEQDAALQALRGRVDGLIVMSAAHAPGENAGLLHIGVPAVSLDDADAAGMSAIAIDNRGGAVAMVRHLLSRGHRRIAFIGGPAGQPEAVAREQGYRQAMADFGLEEWVVEGAFDEGSGHGACAGILRQGLRPDAVFAGNDLMALGCLFALTQAGVRVPQDVALVGFDDIPLAAYAHPGLTTMRVDAAELGRRAVRLLLSSTGGIVDPDIEPGLLATTLVVRASCAAAEDPQA